MPEPIEIRITLILKLSGDSWVVEAMADQPSLSSIGDCPYCDWCSSSDVEVNRWRGLAKHISQIHKAEWAMILQNGGFKHFKQTLRLSV